MFTHECSFVQLTDIVQYNYIGVSNVVLIDKVYSNNIIIILGQFGHSNSNLHTLYQHKIYLMYVNTLCVYKLETRITHR